MEAALAKVKSELGREAVILHTRCLKRGGVLGIGARVERFLAEVFRQWGHTE